MSSTTRRMSDEAEAAPPRDGIGREIPRANGHAAPKMHGAANGAAPDVAPPVVAGNWALLRWMFTFLAPVKVAAGVAAFWLAGSVGVEILATKQTAAAVDGIKLFGFKAGAREMGFWAWIAGGSAEATNLRWIVGLLVGLVVGIAVLRYLREVANMKLSMRMVYGLREAVYDKLQRVGFGYHDAVSSGQLINRALNDLQNVRQFVQTAVLTSLEIALIVGGYILLILTREPWVALLALLPLPFWTYYILQFGKKVQPAAKAVMEAQDKDVSIITENISGVHVIKAFATEGLEVDKYGANADTFYARTMDRIRLMANFTPVIRLIAMASNLTLFFATAMFIIYGGMRAGDFLILGTAMGAILGRLQQVSTISEQYQNAIVSARRLHEVLTAPPTVPEKPDARPLPAGGGAVRFEGVTFAYPKPSELLDDEAEAALVKSGLPKPPPGREFGPVVLHELSFEVPASSMVAIVGPTGAGKSTLVNLVSRFYDPQQGRILLDGMDLRDLKLDDVRRAVGFVFQETYLFSNTISSNISYGRPGVTEGMIEAAARLAQAHEFIDELPQGYNTVIGERGSSLSGGQRQRLAIARAILHDPRVLVLDDATAAIDPETEDLIRRGMDAVMADRTSFVIAHRISSVKRADLVLVIEDGRVTQSGTHAQLMAESGHYREIANVQLYGDDGPPEEPAAPSHMDRIAQPA